MVELSLTVAGGHDPADRNEAPADTGLGGEPARRFAVNGEVFRGDELFEDFRYLFEIPVPPSLHGKTLAQLALPKTLNLTALAMKREKDGALKEVIPPPLDVPFEPGDRLVLMGRKSHLADFSRM